MAYKDPDKQRAYQREWMRGRKVRMSAAALEEHRKQRRLYKLKHRAEINAYNRIWKAEKKPLPRPTPPPSREKVRWSAELNRMVLVREDGTIKDCGFGKQKDLKPLPW